MFKKKKFRPFIQDVPFDTKNKNLIKLKKKIIIIQFGQNFIPQVVFLLLRKFFLNFLKFLEKNRHPNLEIDKCISIFAFQKKIFNYKKI